MKDNKLLKDIIIAVIIGFVYSIVMSIVPIGMTVKYIIYYLVGLIYAGITIYTDIKAYREGAYSPIILGVREDYQNELINIIARGVFLFSLLSITPLINGLIYAVICLFPIVINVTILNIKCYPKVKLKKPVLTNTIAADSIWVVFAVVTCILFIK